MSQPLIAVTMGDPAGVGPEVCLQLLANAEVCEFATPMIYGDLEILRRCAAKTGLPAPEPSLVRDLTLFDARGSAASPCRDRFLPTPPFSRNAVAAPVPSFACITTKATSH